MRVNSARLGEHCALFFTKNPFTGYDAGHAVDALPLSLDVKISLNDIFTILFAYPLDEIHFDCEGGEYFTVYSFHCTYATHRHSILAVCRMFVT